MWFKKKKERTLAEQLMDARNEVQYLRARIRAVSEHAFKTKRGEAYMLVQNAQGKFTRVQFPVLEYK